MGKRDIGYNFDEQNKIEEMYSEIIMQFLRDLYDKEPENVRHQCLEYDFTVEKATFDLKADTIMDSSHKFFLETWSVKNRKKGWLYNQKVDWILYLNTNNLTLYMLNIKQLQVYEKEIQKFPYYEITQQSDYVICGHIVPIFLVCQWLRIQPIDLKPLAKLYPLRRDRRHRE